MASLVKILIVIAGWIISISVYPQVLISSFPDLNSGGQINSVVEDSLNNKVYVAGNFTSIGGIARKNIARLHHNTVTNTYTVDAGWNPVISMTGEIFSLARYNNRVYLGGNFTSINGNNSFTYLRRTDTAAGSTIDSWNAGSIGPSAPINDLVIDGTNLYVAGSGAVYDNGGTVRYNICSFNASSGALNAWNPNTHPNNISMNWGSLEIVKLKINSNYVYMCGRNFGGSLNDGIVALVKSTAGAFLSFNPTFTFEQVIDCELYANKVFIVNSKIWPGGETVYELDQTTGAVNPGAISFGSGNPYSIERYKNHLFIAGDFQSIQSQSQNYIASVDILSSIPYNVTLFNPIPNSAINHFRSLKIIRNRLYLSDNNLTTISSQSKTGVAMYCLPPHDPVSFTQYDQNVCQEESGITYSVPAVLYANSYFWWYTGSDVTVINNGNNSIQLNFGAAATNGNLNVCGVSYCGLYSDTLSLPVYIFSRPDADAGSDSSLTCVRSSLQLNGESVTSGVNFNWSGPSGFSSSSEDPVINQNGIYILTVSEILTGCFQRDTVFISIDTIVPDVITPTGSFVLTCTFDSLLLDGNSLTVNTSQYWNKSGSYFYPDPFFADSIGQYYFVVVNNINGCRDSSSVIVSENRTPPDIFLTSHPTTTGLVLDTLTCIKDSVWVSGYSNGSSASFSFSDSLQVLSYDDSILISDPGSFVFIVTDTSNGCFSVRNFYIQQYITPPLLTSLNDTLYITCSADSVFLSGSALTPGCTEWWEDESGNTFSNPFFANDTGFYFFIAQRTDNGCINFDSVFVQQIPLIIVDAGTDTMICRGGSTLLEAEITGNFSSLYFNWQPVAFSQNPVSVSPDSTTVYYVSVTDGTGCMGSDSVTVFISPDIMDSILTFSLCDSSGGQIQIYPSGGIPPYQFSIDNGSMFQSSNIFSVPFGTYQIIITDSLGCFTSDTAVVSPNSQLPEPYFLVSTYNLPGDTIILIDLSNPQPDSVLWSFPAEAAEATINSGFPGIIFSDTGAYVISLIGFYSGCTETLSKTIYIQYPDTNFSTGQSERGIKSLELYPNPNSGNFIVEIELYEEQNVVMWVADMNGYVWYQNEFREERIISESVQLNLPVNGTCILRIVSEYDARHIYFIVNGR